MTKRKIAITNDLDHIEIEIEDLQHNIRGYNECIKAYPRAPLIGVTRRRRDEDRLELHKLRRTQCRLKSILEEIAA